ncbi:FliM/FliN family flagellar motor switch protein [Paludisphaera sp.]|uniref:FliM/FliN family flagellar motor switch protein n=1 Tax=Paludisphaera sp. TaxID=2017432 RepID=UPI00301BE84F
MTIEAVDTPDICAGLPRLSRRSLALERRAAGWLASVAVREALAWLGLHADFDRPEVDPRPSALGRPGLVAQLRWPRMGTRLAIGVDIPIVHAVVDRLLGYDRPFAESRLQTTPVEWGVWTYLIVRGLEEMAKADASPFRFGGGPEGDALDLSIDRVGPSPFDIEGLGDVVTIRWAVRVGEVAGAARLWLPSSLASYWAEPSATREERRAIPPGAVDSASDWRAVAGASPMPLGLRRLRVGAVLPLSGPGLTGTPDEPRGTFALVCAAGDEEYRIAVEPEPGSSGRRVVATGPMLRGARTTGGNAMSAAPNRAGEPVVDPLDAPVTLTVELGRISIPLGRLAGLKPGEVLELNRHGREPVEVTSGGRTVARGDLVLIGDELGVRVTTVLL